jgi:hypothetical protein
MPEDAPHGDGCPRSYRRAANYELHDPRDVAEKLVLLPSIQRAIRSAVFHAHDMHKK